MKTFYVIVTEPKTHHKTGRIHKGVVSAETEEIAKTIARNNQGNPFPSTATVSAAEVPTYQFYIIKSKLTH